MKISKLILKNYYKKTEPNKPTHFSSYNIKKAWALIEIEDERQKLIKILYKLYYLKKFGGYDNHTNYYKNLKPVFLIKTKKTRLIDFSYYGLLNKFIPINKSSDGGGVS